jgi:hypothetical protein
MTDPETETGKLKEGEDKQLRKTQKTRKIERETTDLTDGRGIS